MRHLLTAIVLALGLILPAAPAVAAEPAPPVNADAQGLAIRGYDPTAYFIAGRAVQGVPEHDYRWNGATWRFASAEARARFVANPEAYAPAFGGYCAWAISQNYIAPGDPNFWRIVDGRLYLNFNARAKELWEMDVAGAIARGNANWPTVLVSAGNR
jgi:YHS domain-containing protein